ncbi:MAG: adenine-specific methyltransferase EcoRI family protein, partial [Helicobacter sp.]|nr:adenine-specific methyltransferase EcoRI family protein [Helicobacter sp.]
MRNVNLHKAKNDKKDEFYTQLADIENEINHYKHFFKDKVILCNCDDPYESNFFKYFAINFASLGLKRLLCVGYKGSTIAGTEFQITNKDLGGRSELVFDVVKKEKSEKQSYLADISFIPDLNNDGAVNLEDARLLLENDIRVLRPLKGSGDFRSEECIELLKQADIVVTNPPFSLFREYVAQLMEYDKKFLIVGSQNAITYKEIFKSIKENKIWLGYTRIKWFAIPPHYPLATNNYKEKDGQRLIAVGFACWFTNLPVSKNIDKIRGYQTYEQGVKKGMYPKYDNYDAIEVSKLEDIPINYKGVMGVPITFLHKWAPNCGYDIVKFRKGDDNKDLFYSECERESESEVSASTQHNTTQHNTTQHNTTQHNTTQHNTTQHNTTQH